MAGMKTLVVKKTKKHGVKAGQKSLVRPSQKKAVKNGRYQEKEVTKNISSPKQKVVKPLKKRAVLDLLRENPTLMSDTVAGDELDDYLQEPEFDATDAELDEYLQESEGPAFDDEEEGGTGGTAIDDRHPFEYGKTVED
jgi:hypothetical protein